MESDGVDWRGDGFGFCMASLRGGMGLVSVSGWVMSGNGCGGLFWLSEWLLLPLWRGDGLFGGDMAVRLPVAGEYG